MNNKERQLLKRVHDILNVPFGAFGTRSSTAAGFAKFQNDMQTALPRCRQLMHWIATEEPWEGAIEEELTELELWYTGRVKANWQ